MHDGQQLRIAESKLCELWGRATAWLAYFSSLAIWGLPTHLALSFKGACEVTTIFYNVVHKMSSNMAYLLFFWKPSMVSGGSFEMDLKNDVLGTKLLLNAYIIVSMLQVFICVTVCPNLFIKSRNVSYSIILRLLRLLSPWCWRAEQR